MALVLVRIFREQNDYLVVVDGRVTVRPPTLRGVRESVDGAFSPRSCTEQAERIEILRLRLEVREENEAG